MRENLALQSTVESKKLVIMQLPYNQFDISKGRLPPHRASPPEGFVNYKVLTVQEVYMITPSMSLPKHLIHITKK